MTWLVWLALAVVLSAVVAITGIQPKGARQVGRTGLMSVARVVLAIVVLIFLYMAYASRTP